jgi:hypothetical protein
MHNELNISIRTGQPGDSGTWLFDAKDQFVGAVAGFVFNDEQNLVFSIYSPAHAILRDIKKNTKAYKVTLPKIA